MRTLIAALVLSGCCFDTSKASPPPAPIVRAPTAEDARAEAGVALAQKNGWLGQVNYEHDYATASAAVTPVFGSLSFDVRQAVAANVAAVGMRRKDKATFTVDLVDAQGKIVGIYSTVLGKLTE